MNRKYIDRLSKCQRKFRLMYVIAISLVTLLSTSGSASADVAVRPASRISSDTTERMKKVADWQLTQSSWNSSVTWHRGALHAGMMACYEATKDETYMDAACQWAEKFDWQLGWNNSNHADNMACAQAYLELYFLDEQDDYRYRDFKNQSDAHVALWPEYTCSGTSSDHWWWCDALFMAPPALVRLSRATGDTIYTDFVHMMWEDTQGCLYDTEDHLFYRDMNYIWPGYNYNGEKVFWSRGNGWVIAGTARTLQYLSESDSNRGRYETLLAEMASKLKDIQQPDGYWHSDLLSPEHYDNPETSGTGFFTFGIAWGVNNGYLDAEIYMPTVQAGWDALNAAVQPDGLLGWVQPVGADPQSTSPTTTDVFGVGAYLLAGSEVLKYRQAHDPNSIEYFESYSSDASLKTAWTDGGTNGTSSEITLGDYGNNFMEFSYNNGQAPFISETVYTFASPRDFTANNAYYLSVLVRGDSTNTAEKLYVRLQDSSANVNTSVVTDTAVVRTEEWTELGFALSDFSGVDLTRVSKLTIGAGSPQASSATGAGTIRVDDIRLYMAGCDGSAAGDFTGDCKIDLEDFALISSEWMDLYAETVYPTDPGSGDLVAYWPLDTNYDDATGNGYDAAAGSSVTLAPGHTGQSAYFDGTDYQSYLYCANSSGINLDGAATISAWIKSSGAYDQWASIVTKGLSAWRLIRNNTYNTVSFHFNVYGGGEYQANGSTDVFDNEWHNVIAVYDGSEIRLYVDGKLDASAKAVAAVNTSGDPVYIGSRVSSTSSRNWIGSIDEVRIYDRALEDSELLWLYEGQPYVEFSGSPRATDLAADGKINFDDFLEFVDGWVSDIVWP